MKLYVWNNPYSVNWGGTIVYAIADSEEAARALAMVAPVSEFGYTPSHEQAGDLDINRPADRVLDLPCAEIYQWQE